MCVFRWEIGWFGYGLLFGMEVSIKCPNVENRTRAHVYQQFCYWDKGMCVSRHGQQRCFLYVRH